MKLTTENVDDFIYKSLKSKINSNRISFNNRVYIIFSRYESGYTYVMFDKSEKLHSTAGPCQITRSFIDNSRGITMYCLYSHMYSKNNYMLIML